MAPVIWGLDMSEMQWAKFKNSYMWNNQYHLRRTKFVVYQLALIFCVVSESLGTAALSDYIDEQNKVQSIDPRAVIGNNDYVGAASFNIFAGIYVATIFGAAFFFDLFWPERKEIKSVRLAWKICGVLAVIIHLAAAITLTVITTTHKATVKGVPSSLGEWYVRHYFHKDGGTPLTYRFNGRAIAAVVFVWLGWVAVVGSCILLFFSIKNTEFGGGPLSKHARKEGELSFADEPDTSVQRPPPAVVST